MNQSAYLQLPHVAAFTSYLADHLNGTRSFGHRYDHRKTGQPWECTSLHDAFEGYEWNKKTYDETTATLKPLQAELRRSVAEQDDAACYRACVGILDWGGVGKQKPPNLTALTTLRQQHGSLPAYFANVRTHLHQPDFSTTTLWDGLKMNAGFTKLYALLFDDFIIEQQRVGGALGLLARHYCEDQSLPTVPDELAFAYGYVPTTTYANPVRLSRNPSRAGHVFRALVKDAPHTIQNLRANWLLTATLAQLTPASPFQQVAPADRLRALESALFMIGYDVR